MSCETTLTLGSFATGELDDAVAERVALHLEQCPTCAQAVESSRSNWAEVRAAYRPGRASDALRSRVRWSTRLPEPRRWPRVALAGGAALIAAVVLLALAALQPPATRRASLDHLAVLFHDAYVNGATPLDLRTDDAAALSTEFSRRLKFSLHLPPIAGPDLTLLGARLVQVGDELALMLAYRQGKDVLSLTVSPQSAAPLGAGVVQHFRGIDFRSSEQGGHHVVQWTDGQLSYALVSSAAAQTGTGCGICHAPGSGLSNVDHFAGGG